MNETMKDLQDLNTSKDKLKKSGGVVPTNFEFDLKITLIHVSAIDKIDHVSNKYLHDVEDWVEDAIACALDDFHVSHININFALIQEVDAKVGQTFSASYLPIQQVSTIHDFSYVLGKHHGDYVLNSSMGIKQNHTPSKPSKLD